MPPNQNHKFGSALLLNHDEVLVRPKHFLPLTSNLPVLPSDAVSSLKTVVPSVIKQEEPSADSSKHCLNVPSTTSISSTQDLFSASFLEAGLLAESQRLAAGLAKGVVIVRAEQRVNDGYWDEAASFVIRSESNRAKADTCGYWDWQSQQQDDSEAPLKSLVAQNDFAFQEASTSRTAERVLEDAAQRLMNGCRTTSGTKPEHDDYWSWKCLPGIVRADPATISESYWEWHDEKALKALASAVSASECESKRELFSIDHIVQTETAQTFSPQTKQLVSDASRDELDNYWAWKAEAEEGSAIVWRQGSSAATLKGYWDW